MEKLTKEQIDNIKYWVCCGLCDNKKCVRGTDDCEAEQWAKKKLTQSGKIKYVVYDTYSEISGELYDTYEEAEYDLEHDVSAHWGTEAKIVEVND